MEKSGPQGRIFFAKLEFHKAKLNTGIYSH
jgi:hypothetical protein